MRKKILLTAAIIAVSLFSACNMTEEQIDQTLDKVEENLNKEQTSDKEDSSDESGTKEDAKVTEAPTATEAPEPTATPTPTPEPTSTPTSTPTPMPVFVYEMGDAGVVITGVNDTSITKVEIPDAIDGLPVVEVDTAMLSLLTNVESFVVDENNQYLSSRNSEGIECNLLLSKDGKILYKSFGNGNIPEGVEEIVTDAFVKIEKSFDVIIPSSVKKIAKRAFNECSGMKSLVFSEGEPTIEFEAFYKCYKMDTLTLSNFTLYTWKNYFSPNDIRSLTLPEGITVLEGKMLEKLNLLEYVGIPTTVTKIIDHAISCPMLKSVYIPANVMLIDAGAFYGCKKIESIKVDDNNPFYSSKANDGTECNAIIDRQYNCIVLGSQNTVIPDNITLIKEYAFANCEINELTIPSTVIEIENGAFSSSHINTLTIYNDMYTAVQGSIDNLIILGDLTNLVKGISEDVKSVILPETVTVIEAYALKNCENLESVILPEGLQEIQKEALRGCTSLTEIHIPSSVTSIGEAAFSGCKNLKEVNIPDAITEISPRLFASCSNLNNIVIPSNVKVIGYNSFSNCTALSELVISEGVEQIQAGAFSHCKALTNVVIPNSVVDLVASAWYGKDFVGVGAFEYCSNLLSVTLPASITLTFGGVYHPFNNCGSLAIVYAPADSDAAQWATQKGYRVMEPTPTPEPTQAPESTSTINLTETGIPGIYWREEYFGEEFGWPGEFMLICSDGTVYSWVQAEEGSEDATVSKVEKLTPFDADAVSYPGQGDYLLYMNDEYESIIIYSSNPGRTPFIGYDFDLEFGARCNRIDSMPEGYYVPGNVVFETDGSSALPTPSTDGNANP